MPSPIETGAQVRQYRIGPLLGRGGMGEVYAAEDTKLGRKVAIKSLPSSLTHDAERLRRFTQEAKAASALNHPSILTIHDVDEIDGHPFLVVEYIEGQTLRDRQRQAGLLLREALDITGQIASALSAAHAAGIVHRDVKPENIMLRADGLAKLLDFGLAKMALELSATADTVAAVGPNTTPGLVMGTTQYMSPEQARGLKVDHRSDIFSLGVVLYEMVAGQPPFHGNTPSDLVAAILHFDPPPLPPDAPPELARILQKALEKDPDDRPQTAKDLAVDLRRLRKQLEGAADAARSSPAQGSAAWTSTPKIRSGEQLSAATAVQTPTVRNPRVLWIAVAVLAALGGTTGLAIWLGRDHSAASSPISFWHMTAQKVSGLGNVGSPAMSDDGKLLAYISRDAGNDSIWLRQMATGSVVRVAGPTPNSIIALQFTPDGSFLYFTERTATPPFRFALMAIPAFGGTPRPILDGQFGRVAFSPDGKQFVVVKTAETETQLLVANADGSGTATLGTRPLDTGYHQPAWSPSGRQLAVVVEDRSETAGYESRLHIMPAAGGPPRTVTLSGLPIRGISALSWSTDDEWLLATVVTATFNAPPQVARIHAADGLTERITKDVNGYAGLAFSRLTRTIATVQTQSLGSVWIGPVDRPQEAKELPSRLSENDGAAGLAWITDDQLAIVRETDFPSIWVVGVDGSNARRLTEGSVSALPTANPAGQTVLFVSDRLMPGVPEIYSVALADGRVRQLTTNLNAIRPSVSPDGRTLFFQTIPGPPWHYVKMPIDGGATTTLLKSHGLNEARLSPDGQWIAAITYTSAEAPLQVVVLSSNGGTPRVLRTSTVRHLHIAWFPTSDAFLLLETEGGQQRFSRIDLKGGPPRPLGTLPRGIVEFPAISPDGRRVAYYRGTRETDIVLLTPKDEP